MVLAVPTILSSLVMVIYNLADTYFVGMLNNAVQSSAVALAGPMLLSFNAINNLFGVGASSMMSRAMGRKDPETVRRSSSFGFYCALVCGVLFSLAYTVFQRQFSPCWARGRIPPRLQRSTCSGPPPAVQRLPS